MTFQAENLTRPYCNCLALERGLDPVGHAGHFEDCLVVEIPLPWKRDLYTDEKVLSSEFCTLREMWLQRYHAGEPYSHLSLFVAPDAEYSKSGYRRVMFFTRPAGLFTQFEKVEYLIPVELMGRLIWSLYEDRAALPDFEAYHVPENDRVRDILVCTHGTIDVACAKFGYPLYKYLRDEYASSELRVWRVSHFGGHVFAPTLMDMPLGHYWAYLGNEQAAQIVRQDGDVANLRGYYRGWAGLESSFLQTAEYDLWQQHGWSWFNTPKAGEIIASAENEDDPQWAEVRVHYQLPGSEQITSADYMVEISHKVETTHTSNGDKPYAYAQYRVREPITL